MMKANNIWAMVKNRYRLSSRVQMKFEMSFPKFIVGKCRITANHISEIKTKKISLALKGIVFSDTIPLGWFTSSAFIPWEKVVKISISETAQSIDGNLMPSQENVPTLDWKHGTLQLNDPQEITIDLPWSKEFTDYVQSYDLFEI
jgi:hypothetical protein